MELAGEGALMALLEKLKAKLAAEGLFDAARKKPLPYLPRVIGVVTSPTGAVIRDILHRLEDRCPTPCARLAGEGAGRRRGGARSRRRCAASMRCRRAAPVPRPDLVIVARGGGSIEDLWAFNEEVVVRAIAACSIPIISAVGPRDRHDAVRFRRRSARADADRGRRNGGAGARRPAPDACQRMAQRTERCARRYHERGRERLDGAGAACCRGATRCSGRSASAPTISARGSIAGWSGG